MQPSFLMCSPEYFEVAYEINPWMSLERKVHRDQAMKQWQAYYELLTGKLGVRVELLKPVSGLPDLVFTANGGIARGRLFIRGNFRHKERQGEEAEGQDGRAGREGAGDVHAVGLPATGTGEASNMGTVTRPGR